MALPTLAVKGTPIVFEITTTLDNPSSELRVTYKAVSTTGRELFSIGTFPDVGITLLSYTQSAGNHTYTWEARIEPQQTASLSSDVFYTYCSLAIGNDSVHLDYQVLVLTKDVSIN